ncbi:MAG: hypothetical protein HGB01_06895 [Chlorobiaceae bacterium]|nr:hypothetical protein [Chlorobiaceae bacterium]
MQYLTKRGYALLDVASALQKSIRRGDAKLAGYIAQELVASGYVEYVWKRLLTISAEDCHGIITQEIKALHESFVLVNKGKKELKGRIFVSKAVLILAHALKSRDADHLQCLMYDQKLGITDEEIEAEIRGLDRLEKVELPEYTYDVHTRNGRIAGKTKEMFFREEQQGLSPKAPGLFDNLL